MKRNSPIIGVGQRVPTLLEIAKLRLEAGRD